MGVSALLLALVAPAAAQCAGDAIARPLTFIIQADNDRDLAAVMAYYSSDPVFLSPTKPPLRGRGPIRDSYVAMYRDFDPHLTIDVKASKVGNGAATVSGRTGGWLQPRDGGERHTVNDDFEALLLCEGHSWKVASLRWWPAEGSKPVQ